MIVLTNLNLSVLLEKNQNPLGKQSLGKHNCGTRLKTDR